MKTFEDSLTSNLSVVGHAHPADAIVCRRRHLAGTSGPVSVGEETTWKFKKEMDVNPVELQIYLFYFSVG